MNVDQIALLIRITELIQVWLIGVESTRMFTDLGKAANGLSISSDATSLLR